MKITENVKIIEEALEKIKEAESGISLLRQSERTEKSIDKSLYMIECMRIRENTKRALTAVGAIKAEEFKFLNENILPLLSEQVTTDDLHK